jgi:hypothetical protein
LAVWSRHPLAWWAVGVLDGTFFMAIAWLISGRTHNLTMGAWAEDWSAELLGKQPHCERVDGIPMDGYDIDHLVLAPAGAFAVESKYYGPAAVGGTHAARLDQHIETARHRARGAALLLQSKNVGHAMPVVPVLILWGVGTPDGMPAYTHDGVRVISGNNPGDLVDELKSRSTLTPADRRQIADALRHYVSDRDSNERTKRGRADRTWLRGRNVLRPRSLTGR